MKASLSRTFLVAFNTAGEAARQRYFLVLLALAAAVAGLASGLREMTFGEDLKFIADLGFGALFFFGSLLAVVLPVHLFFSELDNRTALTLLARPLRRGEFLAGKLLGVWTLLAALVAIVSAVTLGMVAARHADLVVAAQARHMPAPVFDYAGAALFVALQTVRLGVVAALTLFTCSYARTALFAYGAGLGWLVAGQTAWLAREWFGRTPGWGGKLVVAVTRVVPDLQAFNLGDALMFPVRAAPHAEAWKALGGGLVWIAVLIAVGARLFRNREI